MKKRNPVAKSLRTPKFKQKIVKNKKKYNRRDKEPEVINHYWGDV